MMLTDRFVLEDGAKEPTRAHINDAGLDLYSRERVTLYPRDSHVFDTGVHFFELPPGFYARLESKSGLMCKNGIVCPGGVIDSGYTGSICVMLINLGHEAYTIEEGDKVCQMIIHKFERFGGEQIESWNDRGDEGFGSTGR